MTDPHEMFEAFAAEAIAKSPEPLQELGRFLGDILDEDAWKTADRLLMQLAALQAAPAAPDHVGEINEMIAAAGVGEAVAWIMSREGVAPYPTLDAPDASEREDYTITPLYAALAPVGALEKLVGALEEAHENLLAAHDWVAEETRHPKRIERIASWLAKVDEALAHAKGGE